MQISTKTHLQRNRNDTTWYGTWRIVGIDNLEDAKDVIENLPKVAGDGSLSQRMSLVRTNEEEWILTFTVKDLGSETDAAAFTKGLPQLLARVTGFDTLDRYMTETGGEEEGGKSA